MVNNMDVTQYNLQGNTRPMKRMNKFVLNIYIIYKQWNPSGVCIMTILTYNDMYTTYYIFYSFSGIHLRLGVGCMYSYISLCHELLGGEYGCQRPNELTNAPLMNLSVSGIVFSFFIYFICK